MAVLSPRIIAGPFGKVPHEVVPSVGPVQKWTISGITKDSTGTPLAGCTVHIFETMRDLLMGLTVSDGGGNYSLSVTPSNPQYCVAYLAGFPDVAGTTVNTLTGVQT